MSLSIVEKGDEFYEKIASRMRETISAEAIFADYVILQVYTLVYFTNFFMKYARKCGREIIIKGK
jgi:hypothetical protein